MKLLLDTHMILWFLANDPKLRTTAQSVILDPANVRWVSPISLLEIAIKNRLGKLPLPDPFAVMFPASLHAADIHILPLETNHIELLKRSLEELEPMGFEPTTFALRTRRSPN